MSATYNDMGNFYNFEQKKEDTKDYIEQRSIYKSSKSGKLNYIFQ